MSEEEKPPLRVTILSEKPVMPPTCTHRYRVAAGRENTIRYCTRCGQAWLLEVLVDIVTRKFAYAEWRRIREEGPIDESEEQR